MLSLLRTGERVAKGNKKAKVEKATPKAKTVKNLLETSPPSIGGPPLRLSPAPMLPPQSVKKSPKQEISNILSRLYPPAYVFLTGLS